jgi:hypothetical protein
MNDQMKQLVEDFGQYWESRLGSIAAEYIKGHRWKRQTVPISRALTELLYNLCHESFLEEMRTWKPPKNKKYRGPNVVRGVKKLTVTNLQNEEYIITPYTRNDTVIKESIKDLLDASIVCGDARGYYAIHKMVHKLLDSKAAKLTCPKRVLLNYIWSEVINFINHHEVEWYHRNPKRYNNGSAIIQPEFGF